MVVLIMAEVYPIILLLSATGWLQVGTDYPLFTPRRPKSPCTASKAPGPAGGSLWLSSSAGRAARWIASSARALQESSDLLDKFWSVFGGPSACHRQFSSPMNRCCLVVDCLGAGAMPCSAGTACVRCLLMGRVLRNSRGEQLGNLSTLLQWHVCDQLGPV